MRPFTLTGAGHFCQAFTPATGVAERSLEEFRQQRLVGTRLMREGRQIFNEYRACALRDAERSLFLSASHYRRGLDLMVPSSSHWAQVTFYYGAWFAARALLGLFGCVVFTDSVVHVRQSSPGQQRLQIQRLGSAPGSYYVSQRGSHRRFWEIFYKTVPQIRSFVDPAYSPVLAPIGGKDVWMIEERNKINYNTNEMTNLQRSFIASFSENGFPNTLPGALNTQYKVCEGILGASCSFAHQFGLTTDALDIFGPHQALNDRVRDLIYNPQLPSLTTQTKKYELFGI